MDHIHTTDNSSPHPTENPTASLIQGDPSLLTPNRREPDAEHLPWYSLPPSTTNCQYPDKPPPRSNPLFRGFERPNFSRIAILTGLCLVTYPLFYLLTFVAKDKSLFIVRAVVSVWCWVVGFALGYILLSKIGARHLEAASEFASVGCSRLSKSLFRIAWATVVHTSHKGDGMKLRDLARSSSNPQSFIPALHLFRSRFKNRNTTGRSRKSYESVLGLSSVPRLLTLPQQATMVPVLRILPRYRHPWSPISFPIRTCHRDQNLLRRTCHRPASLYILILEQNRRKVYREVLIAGDLSEEDVSRANYVTLNYRGSAPETAELVYGKETVYFVQPNLAQFVPGGSGAGTFNPPTSIILRVPPNNTLAVTGRDALLNNTGVVLRYAPLAR